MLIKLLVILLNALTWMGDGTMTSEFDPLPFILTEITLRLLKFVLKSIVNIRTCRGDKAHPLTFQHQSKIYSELLPELGGQRPKGTKSALLLNLNLTYWPPFLHFSISFPREAEQHDQWIVETHHHYKKCWNSMLVHCCWSTDKEATKKEIHI